MNESTPYITFMYGMATGVLLDIWIRVLQGLSTLNQTNTATAISLALSATVLLYGLAFAYHKFVNYIGEEKVNE